MTHVYLLSPAEAALKGLEPAERDNLVADLQKLPYADATTVEFSDKTYRAAVVADGWAAVYRSLSPDEVEADLTEPAIAVMDLLPINQEQSAAVAAGPVTA